MMKGRSIAIMVLLALTSFASFIPEAFANTPVVVNNSGNFQQTRVTGQQFACYSGGYHLIIYNSGGNLVYSTSPDGGTWTTTTIEALSSSYQQSFSMSCDGSGNVYYAYGHLSAADSNFYFRYGSMSAGVITWTIAETTIGTGHPCAGYVGVSISATSPSNIWASIPEATNDGCGGATTYYDEVMVCTTTCGNSANWVTKTTISNTPGGGSFTEYQVSIVALSTSSIVNWFTPNGVSPYLSVAYTANGGTSWNTYSTSVSTPSLVSPAITIGTTTYVTAGDAVKHMFLCSYVAAAVSISCSSALFTSQTVYGVGLLTDGISTMVFTYPTSASVLSTITSTNSGVTFGAPVSLITTNYATTDDALVSPPFVTGATASVYWVDSGSLYFSGITPSSTIIQACNFNELQCWWYPMLFYGVYAGGFMLVAAKGQVGGKGFTFMLLAALTICSLIQVQMGMMNLLMPVGLTLASIVYAVRSG